METKETEICFHPTPAKRGDEVQRYRKKTNAGVSPKKSFKGQDLSIPGAGKSLFLNHPYDFPVIGLTGTAAIPAPIDWMNESPAMKNSMIMQRPVEKRIMAVLSAIKSRICLFFLLTPWFPVIELTSEECGICCAPRAKCGVPSSG